MISEFSIQLSTVKPKTGERLQVNLYNGSITAVLGAYKFLDKDTKQHIIYLPALEVSAYGETEQKATEMFDLSAKDCFDFLLSMKQEQLEAYLLQLKWKRGGLESDFSRKLSGSRGELQDFNADEISIENITLTAA